MHIWDQKPEWHTPYWKVNSSADGWQRSRCWQTADGIRCRPSVSSSVFLDQDLALFDIFSPFSQSNGQDILLRARDFRHHVHGGMPLPIALPVSSYPIILGYRCWAEMHRHARYSSGNRDSEQLQRFSGIPMACEASLEPPSASQATPWSHLPLFRRIACMRGWSTSHVLSRSLLQLLWHSL